MKTMRVFGFSAFFVVGFLLVFSSSGGAEPEGIALDSLRADASAELRGLVEKLYSSDAKERISAVQGLGKMGERAAYAIPFLVAMLGDDVKMVESKTAMVSTPGTMAAEALGKIGKKAVEPLIEALKSKNPVVRRGAIVALGEIKDPMAAEPLVEALKDEDQIVRSGAPWVLSLIKDKRAVEPLIAALRDQDRTVRRNAEIALTIIEPDWVRGEAARRQIPEFVSALKLSDSFARWKAADVLIKIGEASVEPLIKALEGDSEEAKGSAIWALSEIKDTRAVEPLIEALDDREWNIRENAHNALSNITGEDFGEDADAWKKWWKNKRDN